MLHLTCGSYSCQIIRHLPRRTTAAAAVAAWPTSKTMTTQRHARMHTTHRAELVKKPVQTVGNTLGFSFHRLEKRLDSFPPHMRLIYRSEASTYIYAAQMLQVRLP